MRTLDASKRATRFAMLMVVLLFEGGCAGSPTEREHVLLDAFVTLGTDALVVPGEVAIPTDQDRRFQIVEVTIGRVVWSRATAGLDLAPGVTIPVRGRESDGWHTLETSLDEGDETLLQVGRLENDVYPTQFALVVDENGPEFINDTDRFMSDQLVSFVEWSTDPAFSGPIDLIVDWNQEVNGGPIRSRKGPITRAFERWVEQEFLDSR